MRYPLLALCMALLVAACASDAMKTEDIDKVQANCSDVDQKIAMLQKEKADNDNRGAAGVQSVLPVAAVFHLVSGDYGQNVSIVTGEWAAKIDLKLQQLSQLKASCPQSPLPPAAPATNPVF
jgi:hypothetical protein